MKEAKPSIKFSSGYMKILAMKEAKKLQEFKGYQLYAHPGTGEDYLQMFDGSMEVSVLDESDGES